MAAMPLPPWFGDCIPGNSLGHRHLQFRTYLLSTPWKENVSSWPICYKVSCHYLFWNWVFDDNSWYTIKNSFIWICLIVQSEYKINWNKIRCTLKNHFSINFNLVINLSLPFPAMISLLVFIMSSKLESIKVEHKQVN